MSSGSNRAVKNIIQRSGSCFRRDGQEWTVEPASLGAVVGGVPGKRQEQSKDLGQEQSWRVEWGWHTVAMGKWHKGRWEKLVRDLVSLV